MKLLTTIVALMSVSSASAWGRPRGHDLAIPRGTPAPEKVVLHKEESVEASLAARGGAAKAKEEDSSRLVRLGDIGNALVIGLSIYLLFVTMKLGKATIACGYSPDGSQCIFPPELQPKVDSSFLDDCYVCDGFCVSNPLSRRWNSHMLSLYIDLIMTVPLAWIWFKRQDVLVNLGLADYFVSSQKIMTIAGHGAAHWGLSKLSFSQREAITSPTAQTVVAGTTLASHLITPDILGKLKKLVRIIHEKEENDKHCKHLNRKVAHFLAPIGVAQTAVSGDSASIAGKAIMFLTLYVLLQAGMPPAMDHVKLLAAVSSAVLVMVVDYIVTGLSPGDPLAGLGLTFVVVFSALYAISAVAQLFFWSAEEKNSQAKPYAISAWASSLLTTLVGWALALKCTFLRDWTGHALYDFSIPLSYLIVYFWMKYF